MEQENNSNIIMTDYINNLIAYFDSLEIEYIEKVYDEKQVILLTYAIQNGPEITLIVHFDMDDCMVSVGVVDLFTITDKAMLPYFYELANRLNSTQRYATFGIEDEEEPCTFGVFYNMPVQENSDPSIIIRVLRNVVESCEQGYLECMKLTLM